MLADFDPQTSLMILRGISEPDTLSYHMMAASAKGMDLLCGTINRINRATNRSMQIASIHVTRYTERIAAGRKVGESIDNTLGQSIHVFDTKIPVSIKVEGRNIESKSIIEYQRSNKVAEACLKFAKKLEDRINGIRK